MTIDLTISDITIIMLSAEWMVMLFFLVQSVPMVRLECTDGALLRAECYGSHRVQQQPECNST